ncbi:MAG: squalene/phytoene synthase family protein [Myxococcota bacterium]
MIESSAEDPSAADSGGTLKRALDFCDTMLGQVSRTFAVSIQTMPPELGRPVQIAYLLCRVVDTVEDEAELPHSDRMRLFTLFDQALVDDNESLDAFEDAIRINKVGFGKPDGELCQRAGLVFCAFRQLDPRIIQAIRPHVAEMSTGMRAYCTRAALNSTWSLSDMVDLERYCFYVAGTVGNLLTELFEQRVPELSASERAALREMAVSFGIGLQLVNVLKDIGDDAERGVCFLPRAEARNHGIDLNGVLDPENRSSTLALIGEIASRARRHLEVAIDYTTAWPMPAGADIRMFCTVPLCLALATLREIETGDDTARAGHNPKVPRSVVKAILVESVPAVASDSELRRLFIKYGGGDHGADRST